MGMRWHDVYVRARNASLILFPLLPLLPMPSKGMPKKHWRPAATCICPNPLTSVNYGLVLKPLFRCLRNDHDNFKKQGYKWNPLRKACDFILSGSAKMFRLWQRVCSSGASHLLPTVSVATFIHL